MKKKSTFYILHEKKSTAGMTSES